MSIINKYKPLIIALLIIPVIGFTFAYFMSTSTYDNEFSLGDYSIVTKEVFTSPDNWSPGETIPKSLTAKNEGQLNAVVRVKYKEEWTDDNGDVIENVPDNAALINFTSNSNWIKYGNYYYYNKKLKPNDESTSLIESVTLNPNLGQTVCTEENGVQSCEYVINTIENANYKLTFTIETADYDNYNSIWNTSFYLDGTSAGAKKLVDKSSTTTNTKEMVLIEHVDTEQIGEEADYRYMGSNPNNHILFNCQTSNPDQQNPITCEEWRIIGVIDGKIKIIRDDSIGTSKYNGKNCDFDINCQNNWPDSYIYNYLNNDYYNTMTDSAKSKIDNATWYLGGWIDQEARMDVVEDLYYESHNSTWPSYSIFPEAAYKAERGTAVQNGNATILNANVGLMYFSDYGFASSECYSTCLQTSNTCGMHKGDHALGAVGSYMYQGVWYNSLSYHDSKCTSTNWLYNSDECMITLGNTSDRSYVCGVSSCDGCTYPSREYEIHPTVYLKYYVDITGTGTMSDPYKILP